MTNYKYMFLNPFVITAQDMWHEYRKYECLIPYWD